jgi:hypothetical protein
VGEIKKKLKKRAWGDSNSHTLGPTLKMVKEVSNYLPIYNK